MEEVGIVNCYVLLIAVLFTRSRSKVKVVIIDCRMANLSWLSRLFVADRNGQGRPVDDAFSLAPSWPRATKPGIYLVN
jgi:hypothetical protein